MKNVRKLFMLGLMLLGVVGVNCKDNPSKVQAAEPESSVTFQPGGLRSYLKKGMTAYYDKIVKVTITNDVNKINNTYTTRLEVGLSASSTIDGFNLPAYLFKNTQNSKMYDCVIYNDVKTIYANSNCSQMFYGFSALKEIVFDESVKFDTSNVTDMSSMFFGCRNLAELNLSNFDTSKVTNMSSMFNWCTGLTTLNVSKFDTSKVTNMNNMFAYCSSLTKLDVSNFDTSNVKDMGCMFWGCNNLTELDLSKFDTSKVTDMSGMFWDCKGMTELDLSSFDTSNVTSMNNMFRGCSSLTELDLSNFDMSKVTDVNDMLNGMTELKQIKTPNNLGNNTIKLPIAFTLLDPVTGEKITQIDNSMINKEITRTSKELAEIVAAINALKTCDDYAQVPSVKAQYDALDDADKEAFAKFKNSDDVLLIDKLEYMEQWYEHKLSEAYAPNNQMLKTLESNDYSVVTIAVLALTSFIGIAGYYFIQKRKNINA